MAVKTTLATVIRDAKFAVTVIGAVAAAGSEILPVVPAQWQHWVSGGIAVLTIVGRDIADAVSELNGVEASGTGQHEART